MINSDYPNLDPAETTLKPGSPETKASHILMINPESPIINPKPPTLQMI